MEAQYDAFFIGGGNLPILNRHPSSDQLVTPLAFTGKKAKKKKAIKVPKYDLDEFSGEHIQVSSAKTLFLEYKKKAFDIFDFLSIKSQLIAFPLTEEELILNDKDHGLIEGLSDIVGDYHSFTCLAMLYAYMDMGIFEVQFRQKDNCPICKAFDGSIFDIEKLINLLARNDFLTHASCDCTFSPIIRREVYSGLLDDFLDIDSVTIGSVQMLGVPVELEEDLVEVIASSPHKFGKIEFLDILDYFRDNNLKYKGEVVYQADRCYVHNSYMHNLGPVDFLRAALEDKIVKDSVDVSELDGDVLYLKGEKVIEKDGSYWSIKTGKRVQ